ncbi:MAG: NAD-dependent epimerase/dehydratase family protein [Nitrospirales bacterium]|nr:NAD-dependent epimerase/dehydratase family protein [Nitrospirales bacterium]
MNWAQHKILVTGGASFIGSHLVQALVGRGAFVRVVDNLSSGKLSNLAHELSAGAIEFIEGDLREQEVARHAVEGMEYVFHLAADHGGRGYLETHQAACAGNLALDGLVFLACREAGVEKVVYASSGCVYPNFRQKHPKELVYLKEDMVGPPYDADNIYGYAKLMGELTLQIYSQAREMKAVSCRYFTAYGERCKEDHAIMAMIARAFVRQDPFEMWGTGEQIRNWTYVADIVQGTILAAEKINDGRGINLGTMERTRVIEAAQEVQRYMGYSPQIERLPNMPTGPYNRVADNTLAKHLLGWEPQVRFLEGLHRTIDWYVANHQRNEIATGLESLLNER